MVYISFIEAKMNKNKMEVAVERDEFKLISENNCCDGWATPINKVNGKCPDCEMETVDGFAASGCNHSPIACKTCGHAPCDGYC